MPKICSVLPLELVLNDSHLGKRSILASCTQLQFTCQSMLSLRYNLRSVYATAHALRYSLR